MVMGAVNIDFIGYWLPKVRQLELSHWDVDLEDNQITCQVVSSQNRAKCPGCEQLSGRTHSSYERRLRDLNWGELAVTLQLKVHKFFCDNPKCERRIFTERLPQLVAPWARRTVRLSEKLKGIGVEGGGSAGARLLQQLGYSFSRDTVLRCVAKVPLPAVEEPKSVGVDDFAFRKGQRYGTVVVDLKRRRPIALLKDREAETLASWLEEHPGIEILSRDRSKSYRQGMREGAPQAVQVADRFHLLQNLVEPLEKVFSGNRKALKAAVGEGKMESSSLVFILPPSRSVRQSQQSRAQRQDRYRQVMKLHRQGWSAPAIGHRVGVSARTVRRYLKHESFPERQTRSDRGLSPTLDPYKSYLLKEWNAGCYEGRALFRALQQQGYRGSYMTVARYVQRLRQALGLKPGQIPSRRLCRKVVARQGKVVSPRSAAWLVLRRPEKRKAEEKVLLESLRQQHPHFRVAIELAEEFIKLVRERLGEQLDNWLNKALQSALAPFEGFAQSLQEDYAAVKAGLTLAVSNGPTEGHINRLKMLKRQMYGRAGLELLRRRFLRAG